MATPLLEPDRRYRVLGYCADCSADFRRRLLSFGLIPQAEFQVLRRAPFNGPLQIAIGEQLLALRMRDFSLLELEAI